MKKTALIMAGGIGERFWPRSRKVLPKQFLSLTEDNKTMIQLTVERILPLVDMEDIYIATNEAYKGLVMEQLPLLPEENILCEPVGRNTAPCIGLGAACISKKYEDALMMVLPSDHVIKCIDVFRDTLTSACEIAEAGENLVTMGITPNYPETGYGYIKFYKDQMLGQGNLVEQFVEKPDLETAKAYLASGEYLWNSGMFVWKVSTILKRMEEFLPETYTGLMTIKDAVGTENYASVLKEQFTAFTSVSIDYGILEKADNIYTLPGNFGWDDVGSWLAVKRLHEPDEKDNLLLGNVIAVDCQNTIVEGKDRLIAMAGVKDLIVVDEADALLICHKDNAAQIKDIIAQLREKNLEQYL